jgi:hypothetical protein
LLEDDYHGRTEGLPDTLCPGQDLTIEPDGTAYCCCTAGSSNNFLAVGNIKTQSLAELYQLMRRQTKFRLLRDRGPIFFARAAIARGQSQYLRAGYAGPCDLCTHIARTPQLAAIAEKICIEEELRQIREAWGLTDSEVAEVRV